MEAAAPERVRPGLKKERLMLSFRGAPTQLLHDLEWSVPKMTISRPHSTRRFPAVRFSLRRAKLLLAALLTAGGAACGAAQNAAPRGAVEGQAPSAELLELLPPAPDAHPALKDDGRLAKPVTAAAAGVTITELLAELAEQSGVPLTTSRDLSYDMVTAGFKNRPLVRVLSLLSTHFGFTWRRKQGGYELWQDLASKQREEALRNRQITELIQYLIHLGKMAEQPPAVIDAALAALSEKLKDPRLSDQQRQVLERERSGYVVLARPDDSLALRLLARSPAARLNEFLAANELRFSTATGEISRDDIARWQAEKAARNQRRLPLPANIDTAAVEYSLPERKRGGTGASGISLKLELKGGQSSMSLGSGISLPRRNETLFALPVDPRLQVAVPPISRSLLYAGSFKTGPYRSAWEDDLARWPDLYPSRADFLLALHHATGLDVLSDSFSPWEPANGEQPIPNIPSFQAALSRLFTGSAMRIEDGVLRIRSPHYYHARPITLSRRQVQEEARRLQPDTRSLMDALIRLAAVLRPGQKARLAESWGYLWANDQLFVPHPERWDRERLMQIPSLLARFSGGVRKRLLAGERVSLRSLTRQDLPVLEGSVREVERDRARTRRPRPESPAPPGPAAFLHLQIEDMLYSTHASYREDGKRAGLSRGPFRPDRQPAHAPGEAPMIMVGSPYPVTRFTLLLRDVDGNPVEQLGRLTLIPPGPYQIRRDAVEGAPAVRPRAGFARR